MRSFSEAFLAGARLYFEPLLWVRDQTRKVMGKVTVRERYIILNQWWHSYFWECVLLAALTVFGGGKLGQIGEYAFGFTILTLGAGIGLVSPFAFLFLDPMKKARNIGAFFKDILIFAGQSFWFGFKAGIALSLLAWPMALGYFALLKLGLPIDPVF